MKTKTTSTKPKLWEACDCLSKYKGLLREKGFTLHRKLSALMMSDNTLSHVWVLPLERLDGKPLRSSDPATLSPSFCPMCGNRLSEPKPEEEAAHE